jgi:hypothetical protein
MTGPAIPTYGARQAQPLDTFQQLERILQGIDLNGMIAGQAALAMTPDQQQACAIAARFFGTADGLALLEFLADHTVRKPLALPPVGTEPMQAYLHVQRREGQNDMLFFILRLIAMGREQSPEPREGSQL